MHHAEYYGVAILPAKPYHPHHKGKVERGVAYVKDNALKGRRFATLSAEAYRTLLGLLDLTREHEAGELDRACEQALGYGANRLKNRGKT